MHSYLIRRMLRGVCENLKNWLYLTVCSITPECLLQRGEFSGNPVAVYTSAVFCVCYCRITVGPGLWAHNGKLELTNCSEGMGLLLVAVCCPVLVLIDMSEETFGIILVVLNKRLQLKLLQVLDYMSCSMDLST